MSKNIAIIPAAGAGVRMGMDRAKQFLNLAKRPILAMTLESFQDCGAVDAVIVVVPEKDVDFCKKEIVEKFGFHKVEKVVPGGARRQDSVRLGIEAINQNCELVVIHDGVRPFITADDIGRMVSEAKIHGAVIAGLPAKETVKEVNGDLTVTGTYDRNRVWLIQTPQVFQYQDILKAHQKAFEENWGEATDDSALVEKLRIPVKVILGTENNIKVTTTNDLALAGYLSEKMHDQKR